MPTSKKKPKIKPKKAERTAQKPPKTEASADDFKLKRTKIKVIGIGDGGSQIVAELAKELKKVDFVAANTDWRKRQKFSPSIKTFNFGEKYTRGLGAGMDPEVGRLAALTEKDKIAQIVKGSDLCFLISSLGGGTGSGAAPVFAKICQQEGILSFGIFTLPFKFEGEKKFEVAKEALEKMRANLNTTLILPNEKIFQTLDKNISFQEGFSAINRILSQGLSGLIGLIFQPGLINIDFADLKTILDGRGKPAYLASCEFDRGTKIDEIKKKIFQNVFLTYNFHHSRQVLFNIVSDANLSLNEVSEISQLVFNAVHAEAKIIFGVSFNTQLLGKVRVVLLAIGGREKNLSDYGKKPPKKPKAKSPKKKEKEKKPESAESQQAKIELKVRRNAIQVREEAKAEEENIMAKEKIWETPAIIRRGAI